MQRRQAVAVLAAGTLLSGLSPELFASAAKTAPIDTIFAQGDINPYSKFFTGTTYLTMVSENDPVYHCPIGNVTFEPGARTFWHKHSGGQILLVLAGEGRIQIRGEPASVIKKGDIVRIPPNAEHWHGAAAGSWMTHLSIEPNVPGNQSTWLEAVTDADYAAATAKK